MDYDYENNLLLTEIRDILLTIQGAVRLPVENNEYEVVASILDEIRSQNEVEVVEYNEQGVPTVSVYSHTQLLESSMYTYTDGTVYDEIQAIDIPVVYRDPVLDSLHRIDTTLFNVVVPFAIIIVFIIGMRWLYDR